MDNHSTDPQPYVKVLYPWRYDYYPAQVMPEMLKGAHRPWLVIYSSVLPTLIQWVPANNTFHIKVDRRRAAEQYVGEDALYRNWQVMYWEYCPSPRDIRIGDVLRLTELEAAQLRDWPIAPIV